MIGDSGELVDLTGPTRRATPRIRSLWGRAAEQAAQDEDSWETSDRLGDPMLREVLADLFDAPAQHLRITAGVRAAAAVLADLHPNVTVEHPTFAGVPRALISSNAQVVHRTWQQLADTDDGPEPALRWVTTPFRNPDGNSLEDRDVARMVGSHRQSVVVNDVYRWYRPRPGLREDTYTVGSFAKLTGGGARVGWIYDPADRLGAPSPRQVATVPARILQRTWAHFLRLGGLENCLQDLIDPTVRSSAAFAAAAPWVDVEPGSPFALIACADGINEEKAVRRCHDLGVAVGPGSAFHAIVAAVRVCFTGVDEASARQAAEALTALRDEAVFR